jgi:hypothetical protein
VTRSLMLLVGVPAAMWLLLGLPARHLTGNDDILWQAGAAALLCTLPGAAALIVITRLTSRNPGMLPLLVMGATGVRMFAVLIVGMLLAIAFPFFRAQAFWLWLVVFYLTTLALDVGLLLKSQPSGPAKS